MTILLAILMHPAGATIMLVLLACSLLGDWYTFSEN
jgi:hypothetical protein